MLLRINILSSDGDKVKVNLPLSIIKVCFEKGATLYSANDYRQSNKYFSKIMTLAGPDSADYKLAKARLVNV